MAFIRQEDVDRSVAYAAEMRLAAWELGQYARERIESEKREREAADASKLEGERCTNCCEWL